MGCEVSDNVEFCGVYIFIDMCAVVRLKEKFKIVRVSRAFDFYIALHEYLVLANKYETMKQKFEKKVMAATRYCLFYIASDMDDASNKDPNHVHFVLDRKRMWDCNRLAVRFTAH